MTDMGVDSSTLASSTLANFSAVDAGTNGAELVAALDEIAAIPAVQRLRASATELLAPRLGDVLVDVGCGTGDVVRALAGSVGRTGRVIGIESSETMLAEARRRSTAAPGWIEFRSGDAAHLPVDDRSVDGARCERVFQHLDEPADALAELVRVTRPGRQIVVVDTDWGMQAVHGADRRLTGRVLASWVEHARNGRVGRALPALFADAGIRNRTIVADTITTTDPGRPSVAPFTVMAAAAVQAGAVTGEEAASWLEQLADSARRGRFFWAVTMFAVGGERPSHGT
jgi:SAM-dependent methyltransferase